MRRTPIALSLLGALGAGCARPPRATAPPEPPPEPPAVAVVIPSEPTLAVREAPPAVFADPERRKKIEATLPAIREAVSRIVAADRLVGLAVGIVVDGELVLGEGFGARHVEEGGAIDVRTAFRIGSITKVFTAMAALRLAEAGKLDLDAPAAKVLPELHTLVYPSADARRLTVRDILTHTAGLPRNPDLPPLAVDRETTREELMQAIDGLSLVRAPGVAYDYSNLGFSLLGHVVAAADGRPYHDAIRGAILGPLGMRHTVWERSDVAPERLAIGHAIENGAVVAQPPTRHGAIDAAGGLFSTVEDLARLVAFQLDAWPPRGGDDEAPLARTSVRDGHAARAFVGFRARTRPVELVAGGVEGGMSGVGLGWHVTHGCEQPHVVGHNGAVDGYHATIRMLPQASVGVIVLGNAGWADTDHVADEILRALEGGGGLKPRAPQALPELTAAAQRVTQWLSEWDDAAFAAATTQALRGSSARVGELMRWLHAALGACTLGPLKRPTSAWSGVFRLECERGGAELSLALTTARTPMIAGVGVSWIDGTPTAPVQDAAAAAVALLEQFDEEKHRALFSPGLTRTAIERLAALVRFEHGVCRLGRPLEVTGPGGATFALTCDRGSAKLTLELDDGRPGQIVGFRVQTAGQVPPCR